MSLRRLPGWACILIALLPVVALTFVADQLELGARLAVAGFALAWSCGWIIFGWLRLDEASREAYKFAWFWGGATGLVLLQLAALAALLIPELGQVVADFVTSQARADAIPETGFALGVFAASFAQVAAYGLVWLGWWISRRTAR